MNSTDPFPHKREPIPAFKLDAVDRILIHGVIIMVAFTLWWALTL